MEHAYFEPLPRQEWCDYCAGRRHVATLAPNLTAIYCISLQEQPHRTAKAATQFHALGLCRDVLFYRPVRGCDTDRAIWDSHRAVAADAVAKGFARILVLEDDVLFTRPRETLMRLQRFAQHRIRRVKGLITVTHELMGQLGTTTVSSQGLPGYTFERSPGGSWRSRLDAERNVIVINNGHRDFVYASRSKSLKLRYLVRLYAKELVMHNFVGLPADQLLERMVELSLRTEEHL